VEYKDSRICRDNCNVTAKDSHNTVQKYSSSFYKIRTMNKVGKNIQDIAHTLFFYFSFDLNDKRTKIVEKLLDYGPISNVCIGRKLCAVFHFTAAIQFHTKIL